MIDIEGKKILLVRNDNVGDLICTTPAIEALRKRYPNNQIDIVVNSYNYDAIHKNPFVDTVYCYTKPKHKVGLKAKISAGWEKLKILLNIRKEKYDVVIVFRGGYSKSAELFSHATHAQYKVGVLDPKGKDKFNIHIPMTSETNEVHFCYDCVKPFDVKEKGENTYFYIDPSLSEKYKQYNNIIVWHISARMEASQMSYAKLKKIIDTLGQIIYITAEPDDFEKARKLESETDAIFMQTSSFLDLGALLTRTKLFLTLDGGAMHLAPALGVPTISFFGKSTIERWYPWGYRDLVLQDSSHVTENIDNTRIVDKVNEVLESIQHD